MEPVVEIESVSKKYDQKFALKNVSVSLAREETIALIGPNGAGKTTLLESILNLKKPDSGSIKVFNIDILKNRKAHLHRVGAHLQEVRLFTRATPRDLLTLFKKIFDSDSDINKLIESMALTEFVDKKVGQLSGGVRQRVSLALAMINDPELVLLDEPTVGLDPIARQEFWNLIKQLQADKKALIFSTHYMEEAVALSDKVIMIHQGQVVFQGPPSEVEKKAKSINGTLDQAYAHYVNAAD
ncbi:MAG: ABC-2 type transport system ATP-binding protein [Arenicella sp.]|jgi:ABC-2 type transport system ATP-binding protein